MRNNREKKEHLYILYICDQQTKQYTFASAYPSVHMIICPSTSVHWNSKTIQYNWVCFVLFEYYIMDIKTAKILSDRSKDVWFSITSHRVDSVFKGMKKKITPDPISPDCNFRKWMRMEVTFAIMLLKLKIPIARRCPRCSRMIYRVRWKNCNNVKHHDFFIFS